MFLAKVVSTFFTCLNCFKIVLCFLHGFTLFGIGLGLGCSCFCCFRPCLCCFSLFWEVFSCRRLFFVFFFVACRFKAVFVFCLCIRSFGVVLGRFRWLGDVQCVLSSVRLFEIVFVSFKFISGFLCVSGSFSCCGLLQVFKVVFCLRCSSVVAGCCKLFLLYCRFQVATGCLVSSE